MIFYIKDLNNEWSPIGNTKDLIARKGLTQWSNIDYEKTRVFHQKLERKWQPVK